MANDLRPIQFLDHLPDVFRADELIELTVQSATDTTLTVAPFATDAAGMPIGTPVFVSGKDFTTTLRAAIPAHQTGLTQIEVRDPWFAAALQPNDLLRVPSLLTRFLETFETLFEELEAAVEGTPGGVLTLTVESTSGRTVTVAPFNSRAVEFPAGTPVTVANKPLRTTLKRSIPANRSGLTEITIRFASVVSALEPGDILNVHPGGIPDLFNPNTTPPPQFKHRPKADSSHVSHFDHLNQFAYFNYLASWIGLPLRAEKSVEWNRRFFNAAIPLYSKRGTLPGIEALLRAWLKDDLLETDPPLLILTDLSRTHNDVDTVFQLAPESSQDRKPGETYAQLGVNSVLGEGPPFLFMVDLITDPAVKELRNPVGLDVFERAARFLLDAEKPAHTYYRLRVRAHTMQLAPPPVEDVEFHKGDIYAQMGDTYARVGETTLLWDEPWVFDSD